jgi:hypothetical protein
MRNINLTKTHLQLLSFSLVSKQRTVEKLSLILLGARTLIE